MAPAFTASHNVWSLDLPGHGSADNEIGDGSVEALAERVWHAVEREIAAPVTLVGHSLGGAIAMALQKNHPSKIARLVLLAPSGLVPLENAQRITRLPHLQTVDEATEHLLDLVAVKRLITRPIVDYLLASLIEDERRQTLAKIADALVANDTITTRIPDNTVLVWGEQDKIFPPQKLDSMRLGVRLHVLPGTGHLLQAEAAQKVARLVGQEIGDSTA